MENTKIKNKLELIELMESLGAKPQAHGDYIVWELDSKDLKQQANKQQAQGSSDKQEQIKKKKKNGWVPPTSSSLRQIVTCDIYFLDMTKGRRPKVHVAFIMDLGHCGTI